jgi:hypothetical protein
MIPELEEFTNKGVKQINEIAKGGRYKRVASGKAGLLILRALS